MSKLSYEDKINIYNEKKKGVSITKLSKKYCIRDNHIKYLMRLIDKHKYRWVKLAIDDYINYYNYDRIKVKLKGLSPVNYRLQPSN